MQVKLNTIVAAAMVMIGGASYAQDMVVKIGHVGPTSGGIAHLGKDNENGAKMAISSPKTTPAIRSRARRSRRSWSTRRSPA